MEDEIEDFLYTLEDVTEEELQKAKKVAEEDMKYEDSKNKFPNSRIVTSRAS